jgi:glutathione peroxidase
MKLARYMPTFVITLVSGIALAWQAAQPATTKPVSTEAADPYVLNHTMKLIDEKTDKNLKDYEGKVVLIVNVASECGYTRQYKGLEKLYQDYKDKGLVILGFPANEFGGQEPGTNAEIVAFCTKNYSVTFPMFAKVVVKGEKATPLFKQLAALNGGKEPSWNFNKYLVGKDGKFVAHYESRIKPDDATFVKAIREALGLKEGDVAKPAEAKPAAPATPTPDAKK